MKNFITLFLLCVCTFNKLSAQILVADATTLVSSRFASLKDELDASFTQTDDQGNLTFMYQETYQYDAIATVSDLPCDIYNWERQKIGSVAATTTDKKTGNNLFKVNVASLGCKMNDFYILEVPNRNNIKQVLRFRYKASVLTASAWNDDNCPNINRVVHLKITGGVPPYKVTWGSTGSTAIISPNNTVYIPAVANEAQTTAIVTNTARDMEHEITIDIEDVCGNTQSTTTTIHYKSITECPPTDPVVGGKKRPALRIVFSIRHWFGKPTTPTNTIAN